MINDIKRGMEERKIVAEAMEQAQNQVNASQGHAEDNVQLQNQLKQQASTRLDQLEVKTISERSQEESNCSTPAIGGGHYHSSSLGTNPEVASIQPGKPLGVSDYNPGAIGQPPKKQIQILELLNEICEDSRDASTLIQEEEKKEQEEELPSTSATEQEEDQVMQQIMTVLQSKVESGSDPYQSLTYTDGIYLQNINGEQLQLVISHLYHLDSPDDHKPAQIP